VGVHVRIVVEFGGAAEAAMRATQHICGELFAAIDALRAKAWWPKKCPACPLLLLLGGLLIVGGNHHHLMVLDGGGGGVDNPGRGGIRGRRNGRRCSDSGETG
jgi:hypothetical protein